MGETEEWLEDEAEERETAPHLGSGSSSNQSGSTGTMGKGKSRKE
jgi:hypothetical protein